MILKTFKEDDGKQERAFEHFFDSDAFQKAVEKDPKAVLKYLRRLKRSESHGLTDKTRDKIQAKIYDVFADFFEEEDAENRAVFFLAQKDEDERNFLDPNQPLP